MALALGCGSHGAAGVVDAGGVCSAVRTTSSSSTKPLHAGSRPAHMRLQNKAGQARRFSNRLLRVGPNLRKPDHLDTQGRHWSGVDPPLSLQPRLPHSLHCHLSSLCALSAIGLVRGPPGSRSLPPRLRSGLWAQGFWALSPGHTLHWRLSLGRGVYSVFHVWGRLYFGRARLRWPDLATLPTLRGLQGHGGLMVREVKCYSIHRGGGGGLYGRKTAGADSGATSPLSIFKPR